MTNKTFSQKSARFFEIACYILLIPATASIIFTFVMGSILFLIPLVITAIGSILLFGYRRHWVGKLDKDKLSRLWFGTLIFNAIPLMPVLYQFIFYPEKFTRVSLQDILYPPVLFSFLLVLWWIVAVSLSITLILDEFKRNSGYK